MIFDYSNHDGFFSIGLGKSEFLTRWSRAGRSAIHSYTDGTNLSIALAPPSMSLRDILQADTYDFSARVRDPRIDEVLIARNHHGRYAAIAVRELKSRSHGDDFDFARMRYLILSDGTSDFNKRV